jgi:hypothetical protein
MDEELEAARQVAFTVLKMPDFMVPWLFERTPASSESPGEVYLRKVREADLVIWLIGSKTTDPVRREVEAALQSDRRIIAIRIAGIHPDKSTLELQQSVGSQAKWCESTVDELADTLSMSISDELTRAMRSIRSRPRKFALDHLGRASRARCIVRWVAAGLSREDAGEAAGDMDLGSLPDEVLPDAEHPFTILVGPVGSGKSTGADRFHQRCLQASIGDASAPIPVWTRARDMRDSLRQHVLRQVEGLGDPLIQGVVLVVDGLDEADSSLAVDLIEQSTELVEALPNTRVLITTRTIPHGPAGGKVRHLAPMSEGVAIALVSRIAGAPVEAWKLPRAVRDAITRPLFAVMLGTLAKSHSTMPRSRGGLIKALAVREVESLPDTAWPALKRLAQLEINAGGRAMARRAVGDRAVISRLADSGLVVLTEHDAAFALQIFAEWFASECILDGDLGIDEVARDQGRAFRWRYALAIALEEAQPAEAVEMFNSLRRHQPALAAELLSEMGIQTGDDDPTVAPGADDALEIGRALVWNLAEWLTASGPIDSLMPFAHDGRIDPIGVDTSSGRLTLHWGRPGDDHALAVQRLPSGSTCASMPSDWYAVHHGPASTSPLWAPLWALDRVSDGLRRCIEGRGLPLPPGPLRAEAAYGAGLALLGHEAVVASGLPVDRLSEAIERTAGREFVKRGGRSWPLGPLRDAVTMCRNDGVTTLHCPWPPPDVDDEPWTWMWDGYSPEQLLRRTQLVYEAALVGYRSLVELWLPGLASRMAIYATLPAVAQGSLAIPEEPHRDLASSPSLHWTLLPIDRGSPTRIDFELGDPPVGAPVAWFLPTWDERVSAFRRLRPECSGWLGPSFSSSEPEVFSEAPASSLAHKWIMRDLQGAGFLRGR